MKVQTSTSFIYNSQNNPADTNTHSQDKPNANSTDYVENSCSLDHISWPKVKISLLHHLRQMQADVDMDSSCLALLNSLPFISKDLCSGDLTSKNDLSSRQKLYLRVAYAILFYPGENAGTRDSDLHTVSQIWKQFHSKYPDRYVSEEELQLLKYMAILGRPDLAMQKYFRIAHLSKPDAEKYCAEVVKCIELVLKKNSPNQEMSTIVKWASSVDTEPAHGNSLKILLDFRIRVASRLGDNFQKSEWDSFDTALIEAITHHVSNTSESPRFLHSICLHAIALKMDALALHSALAMCKIRTDLEEYESLFKEVILKLLHPPKKVGEQESIFFEHAEKLLSSRFVETFLINHSKSVSETLSVLVKTVNAQSGELPTISRNLIRISLNCFLNDSDYKSCAILANRFLSQTNIKPRTALYNTLLGFKKNLLNSVSDLPNSEKEFLISFFNGTSQQITTTTTTTTTIKPVLNTKKATNKKRCSIHGIQESEVTRFKRIVNKELSRKALDLRTLFNDIVYQSENQDTAIAKLLAYQDKVNQDDSKISLTTLISALYIFSDQILALINEDCEPDNALHFSVAFQIWNATYPLLKKLHANELKNEDEILYDQVNHLNPDLLCLKESPKNLYTLFQFVNFYFSSFEDSNINFDVVLKTFQEFIINSQLEELPYVTSEAFIKGYNKLSPDRSKAIHQTIFNTWIPKVIEQLETKKSVKGLSDFYLNNLSVFIEPKSVIELICKFISIDHPQGALCALAIAKGLLEVYIPEDLRPLWVKSIQNVIDLSINKFPLETKYHVRACLESNYNVIHNYDKEKIWKALIKKLFQKGDDTDGEECLAISENNLVFILNSQYHPVSNEVCKLQESHILNYLAYLSVFGDTYPNGLIMETEKFIFEHSRKPAAEKNAIINLFRFHFLKTLSLYYLPSFSDWEKWHASVKQSILLLPPNIQENDTKQIGGYFLEHLIRPIFDKFFDTKEQTCFDPNNKQFDRYINKMLDLFNTVKDRAENKKAMAFYSLVFGAEKPSVVEDSVKEQACRIIENFLKICKERYENMSPPIKDIESTELPAHGFFHYKLIGKLAVNTWFKGLLTGQYGLFKEMVYFILDIAADYKEDPVKFLMIAKTLKILVRFKKEFSEEEKLMRFEMALRCLTFFIPLVYTYNQDSVHFKELTAIIKELFLLDSEIPEIEVEELRNIVTHYCATFKQLDNADAISIANDLEERFLQLHPMRD